MKLTDQVSEYIQRISPYIPGKPITELAREMGLAPENIVKLASNENPLGMSPQARAAMLACVHDIARYPDGNGFALKAALQKKYSVEPEQIVLGNGSNEILELAARTFLNAQTEAIYAQYAFAVYPLATQSVGATGIEVPARNYGHDLAAMLQAINTHTRLIFIANPNNPTGTFIPSADLEAFLQEVPEHVLVVLDEAYNEYLPPNLRPESISWLKRYPNLLVSRTFSKAYGLAGLRIGYALASSAIADLLNRVRAPFNANSMALAAAEAALTDENFLTESYQLNRSGMQQLEVGLHELGLSIIPSYANFITFHLPATQDAHKINQALLKQGIIVRPLANYAMPQSLRVTVGLPEENTRFLTALKNALAQN